MSTKVLVLPEYDALKSKDSKLAESYVERHLHNQAEAVKKIIREQE